MRLAFVYDRLNKIGGAERILVALHRLFPQSPFFTAVYDLRRAPFTRTWDVRPSFMQSLPLAVRHHELFPWLEPFAFESFDFSDFDVVVTITSALAKGILTKPETLHVCYCLTPTRFLWSHAALYQTQGPRWRQPVQHVLLKKLKKWDAVAAERPDVYLAISRTVQKRIKTYYGRESMVLYPPVDTGFFKPQKSEVTLRLRSGQGNQKSGYFLVVSRLVAYKRIELAIEACNKLQLPLVIVGTGSEAKRLQRLAGPTVRFTGQLTDKEVLRYYQGSRALIFPGEEDLGLTMIEALSVGRPIIAYRGGGARELMSSERTGLFFNTPSATALMKTLKDFGDSRFDGEAIRRSASRFDQKRFTRDFHDTIERLWHEHQVTQP